ncbi:MAG TPA: PH domain-containing protein [Spirochaetota bacterium]|nr:PH domain-containing protein [Spirochaetota bacterium]
MGSKIAEVLHPGEEVIKEFNSIQINLKAGSAPKNAWGQEVESDNSSGTLVVTNQRVFHTGKFLLKKWLVEIPLNMVGGASFKKGLIMSEVIISSSAGTRIELVQIMSKKIGEEIVKTVNDARSKFSSQSSNSSSSTNQSIPEQIKKLSELKDQGILTEDEFNKKKSELLAKM